MYKLVGLVVTTSCIWWCFCVWGSCEDVEGKVICCVAQQNPQSRELIPSFLMLHLQPTSNLKDKCQSYQQKTNAFVEFFCMRFYSFVLSILLWMKNYGISVIISFW